jgi:hypothetical protein
MANPLCELALEDRQCKQWSTALFQRKSCFGVHKREFIKQLRGSLGLMLRLCRSLTQLHAQLLPRAVLLKAR